MRASQRPAQHASAITSISSFISLAKLDMHVVKSQSGGRLLASYVSLGGKVEAGAGGNLKGGE